MQLGLNRPGEFDQPYLFNLGCFTSKYLLLIVKMSECCVDRTVEMTLNSSTARYA